MTKLKTYDLIRLRQIDREKFENVIKGYAEFFGKLTDEERKRIFKKDPNAELICEFISKLFKLSIKITEEKEVLERWFDSAKSKGFKGIELTQEIGIDKKKEYLIHLPFWQLNKIINEAEYYGDFDIAEKLLDIEGRTKKAESALELFRGEVNGRLDKVDSEIKEFKQESQQTFITIRAPQYRTAIKSAHEEKDLIELLGDAVVKAAIDGISEAVEEGVKEGVKDLSKISFEQIKKYLLRLSDEELVKLSGEKRKSPEDFVEVLK